jgi:molybdopterin-guanine dinucleotide biosynthesis protein A
MHASLVAGIFVGGGSTRMGGRPKGLLRAPSGETLVERWKGLFEALAVPCVLVGERVKEAYASSGLRLLDDARPEDELGPLGGLLALLAHAGDRAAIVVACDMPFVSLELLRRLASVEEPAPALAARREGRWEPFFARYDARAVLPTALAHADARRGSLQALLDAVRARELDLRADEHAELRDWDTPDDAR